MLYYLTSTLQYILHCFSYLYLVIFSYKTPPCPVSNILRFDLTVILPSFFFSAFLPSFSSALLNSTCLKKKKKRQTSSINIKKQLSKQNFIDYWYNQSLDQFLLYFVVFRTLIAKIWIVYCMRFLCLQQLGYKLLQGCHDFKIQESGRYLSKFREIFGKGGAPCSHSGRFSNMHVSSSEILSIFRESTAKNWRL